MDPDTRQEEIRKLIKQQKELSVEALSDRFQVSKMTIYRDVNPLIKEGLVFRTSGKISLTEENQPIPQDEAECVYCHRPNHPTMFYRLILTNGQIETACCAHCGLLRHRQLGDAVSHALCRDFLLGTTVSASFVWYVINTTLNVSCCQPQVLPFENKEHAEKFTKGFGGEMYGFQSMMQEMYRQMDEEHGGCSHE